MKRPHIIQVSSYYPPHLGGQEHAVQDLAKRLAQAGYEVDVLTSTQGGGQLGMTQEGLVRVHRLPAFVFGHAPIMPRFARALLKLVRPGSIVHVHVGQAFTPEMVWLLAKLRRFSYIVQLHIDFEPSGPAGILLPLYKSFILKRVLRSAAAVVALNPKTLRTVQHAYGYTGNSQILYNGIDEAYYLLKRQALPQKPPKTLRLLYVGRLDRQKNLLALLEALHRTKRNVHLDIIGDGGEREAIRAAIAAHGLTNVTMHGRLSREDILPFYQTNHALIMPSLYEAQPLVLLEAMAARIPIIGTNVIGVADHLGDGGIIVPPTVEGLAEGIARYDREYTQLPTRTQQAFVNAQTFRWPQTLMSYQELYDKILAN